MINDKLLTLYYKRDQGNLKTGSLFNLYFSIHFIFIYCDDETWSEVSGCACRLPNVGEEPEQILSQQRAPLPL